MKKILLVEDDKEIVEALTYILEKKYVVEVALSKKEALEKINKGQDLTVLDISLPDGESFDFNNLIKTPIIYLTARDDEETIVKCLSSGEEYISKPFKSKELILRIEKVLNRNITTNIVYKDITINIEAGKVYRNDEEIILTSLDYKIVELLFRNVNIKITKQRLSDLIYDATGNFVEENTINVYIKRVRDKLGVDYIKTIKKVGYIVEKE